MKSISVFLVLLIGLLSVPGCTTYSLLHRATQPNDWIDTYFHEFNKAYLTPEGELLVLVKGKGYRSHKERKYTLKVPIEDIENSTYKIPPGRIKRDWCALSRKAKTECINIPVAHFKLSDFGPYYESELTPVRGKKKSLYVRTDHPAGTPTSFHYVQGLRSSSARRFITIYTQSKPEIPDFYYLLGTPLTLAFDTTVIVAWTPVMAGAICWYTIKSAIE